MSPERLLNFLEAFDQSRISYPSERERFSIQLETFFSELAACRRGLHPSLAPAVVKSSPASSSFSAAAPSGAVSGVSAGVASSPSLNAVALESLLLGLAEPLSAARRAAYFLDPWEVAGLGSDEGRHAGVLAWLLNPDGSHGLGYMAMSGLLQRVNEHSQARLGADFPLNPGAYCRVRTEVSPNGQQQDRVDIEIDADTCYLIIEVKIMAAEQPGQLERYCRQAEVCSRGRPWAVIFLTVSGYEAQTAGAYGRSNQIMAISWSQLALVLKQELRCMRLKGELSASLSRRMSAHVVGKFLERIRRL